MFVWQFREKSNLRMASFAAGPVPLRQCLRQYHHRHGSKMPMCMRDSLSHTGGQGNRLRRNVIAASLGVTLSLLFAWEKEALSPIHPVHAEGVVAKPRARLSECRADQNCVSSSSVKNPSKFLSPWTFEPETSNPAIAWESLHSVVQNLPGAKVVEFSDTYLHAEVPGFFPRSVDDLEFVLDASDKLVLFKSCGRSVTYIYPLQQPIGDMNTNKSRIQDIQAKLGWDDMGFGGLF
ncbi:hypothetical protein FVE85_5832 [Porphyridium purpureum]|uniref:Thylakoid lumenal 17.9 kDa protein, chloroplastic n=1 Tax=Porphyridium purpureum TaxID=35688 RepID=A0A5J4Z6H2_PORPP|nr:hypothetical protein FVE85_5832 [Porphyridium purpureum]|eukprot:POR5535..scf295_1